ncbi:cell wall hydrolase [Pseudochrobactrum sp. MP213Fo]|uniref:cell wall hydrolase n=1 Tax=Pseudochrobactrum sp. MP213Fo TaxID=3022250 RepID=UPI003B9F0917
MKRSYLTKTLFLGTLVAAPFILAGCTTTTTSTKSDKSAPAVSTAKQSGVTIRSGKKTYNYSSKDRECLERAMFFESARSSRSGLVAVGTVVMNRLVSEKYPETICGVVGQKNQFAPGVMTRAMNSKALPDVKEAAQAVLKGERHPDLKNAMFFHTAGLKFPYKNMHYVLVAGGNAFYEKRRKDGSLEAPLPEVPYNVAAIYEPKDQSMPQTVYDVTETAKAARVTTPDTEKTIPVATPETVMVASIDPQRFAPAPGKAVHLSKAAVTAETPVQVAYHVPVPSEPQHAFVAGTEEMSQKKVDAIGALLLKQGRPEPTF